MKNANIIQEFDESQTVCVRHRLRNKVTGECTGWAGYTGITELGGVVGHTAYFGASEGTCSPEEFVRKIAVRCKDSDKEQAQV